MADTNTQAATILLDDERLPVATFKNSLRQWQALWQAQKPATAVEAELPKKPLKVRPRRGRRKGYRAG